MVDNKKKKKVKNGGKANYPIAIPKSYWDNANLRYIYTHTILQVLLRKENSHRRVRVSYVLATIMSTYERLGWTHKCNN